MRITPQSGGFVRMCDLLKFSNNLSININGLSANVSSLCKIFIYDLYKLTRLTRTRK